MNFTMKKIIAAILMFDILAGLLLFNVYGNKLVEQSCEVQTDIAAWSKAVAGAEMSGQFEEQVTYKKVALTFDDGPHPYYTEQLLDGLKERGVVATFFVTGEHVTLHTDVIKRMNEEGHLIGNHTYSHMQLRSDNREEFKEELVATSEVIEEIIQKEVVYVRPPYGTWDKTLEEELNMIPVLWTVDPLDWCTDSVACVVQKVTEKVEENDIILLHDYYDSTVTAALKIVDELKKEGYTFVTVDEILFD